MKEALKSSEVINETKDESEPKGIKSFVEEIFPENNVLKHNTLTTVTGALYGFIPRVLNSQFKEKYWSIMKRPTQGVTNILTKTPVNRSSETISSTLISRKAEIV